MLKLGRCWPISAATITNFRRAGVGGARRPRCHYHYRPASNRFAALIGRRGAAGICVPLKKLVYLGGVQLTNHNEEIVLRYDKKEILLRLLPPQRFGVTRRNMSPETSYTKQEGSLARLA